MNLAMGKRLLVLFSTHSRFSPRSFPSSSLRATRTLLPNIATSPFRTISASSSSIFSSNKYLEVKLPSSNELLQLNLQWLRDHCRCLECYNSVTCQRSNDILAFDEKLEIANHVQENDSIQVKWSDGHASVYSASWLLQNTFEGKYKLKSHKSVDRITWDATSVNQLKLEPIFYDDIMKDEALLPEIYRRTLAYGFATLENVPVSSRDATINLLAHICRLSTTVFGGFWETGINFDHNDTGYLNGFLESHTDNTYFTEAQGYLVFHCTEFEGSGADSILVDGFHVAKQLKRENPEAYQYLSNTSVEAEYIEPGEHFTGWGPNFLHHPVTNQLQQVRFNMLDRAPLSALPQSEAGRYYRNLRALASLVKKKENEYRLSLRPGTVLIIDNWRLLHGRESYKGKRVLRGCYYTRSDFMSRARHFGIY